MLTYPILFLESEASMAQRPRLQHVSVPRPAGGEALARAFYGELLGLEEIPVPKSLGDRNLVWFRIGENTELHTFPEDNTAPTSGRHLCIEVDDLKGMQRKLAAAGYAPWDAAVIPGRPRFFCRDPFNNQIEFTTIEGDYLQLQ
jgi:catechol 2,3-dioxygenase-like lactoylglutathione lyase family enzyme